MASILFKWFLIWGFVNNVTAYTHTPCKMHPFFVSVTEIEYNTTEQSLQVSCKIFTDDFEKTLRQNCNCTVDLLQPQNMVAMDKLVSDYMQKHLSIKLNDKTVVLNYLGYEQIEEAIYSYWEVKDIASLYKIDIVNNILYDYKKEQVNIVHVTADGNRKSSKLNYPDDKISFDF